jgi:serine/threonine protein kinase/tetratricopeptide (TPR) repeat protein
LPADPHLSKQLFEQALQRPPQERAAFLDGACGVDRELRARVGALLDALDEAGEFLKDPPTTMSAAGEQAGTIIDRYKLLEPIGEGGFGTVWMAEQQEPVRRKVAVKVIKLGMDTKQVVARFEAERQALALMDHPNIAKILDGGATSAGRPYFVMELIRGIPITEYCDQAELDARKRLELFQMVCQAVQHAHHKGVIHRDLKPSNILVTLHDGVPVPKVIDFGVAKATSAELTQRTLFTEFRQMVGTPDYMAPEQAEMSDLDIDTRADVYSLGVVLYELLTGTKPFDSHAIREQGYLEMMRVIREDEPPKPSMRVSTLGDRLAAVARHRHATPDSLSRTIRGDLDWIVMKALEKDRNRRFAAASDLAADVGRYLQDETVHASPPSTSYRLRKFARRNRTLVSAGAGIAVALVAGLAVATWGWFEADAQRRRAELAEADAISESKHAKAQRDRAEKARRSAEAATRFLTATIGLANPDVSKSPNTTARTLLDDAAKRVAGAFAGMPRAEAEVRTAIGEAYLALGETAIGGEHLFLAIELWRGIPDAWPDDLYRALWSAHVARSEQRSVRFLHWALFPAATAIIAAADPEFTEALSAFVHFGGGKPKIRFGGAAEFERLLTVAKERLAVEPDADAARRRWIVLADLLIAAGEGRGDGDRGAWYERALTIYADRGQLEQTDTRIVHARLRYIRHLQRADIGRFADAVTEAEATLATIRGFLLPDHPDHWYIARCRRLLGRALVRDARQGHHSRRLVEAVDHLRVGLGVLEDKLLAGAGGNARIMASLIQAYEGLGRLDKADPLRKKLAAAIAGSRGWTDEYWVVEAALDANSVELGARLEALDKALSTPRDAEPLFMQALDAVRNLDRSDPSTAAAVVFLMRCAHRLVNQTSGKFLREGIEAAFSYGAEVLTTPEYRYLRGEAIWRAADIQRAFGDYEAAEKGLRLSLSFLDAPGFSEPIPGQRHFRNSLIAICMFNTGDRDAAEKLALEAFTGIRAIRGDNNHDVNTCFAYLIGMQARMGRDKRAAAIQRCVDRIERMKHGEAASMGMSRTLTIMTYTLGTDAAADRGATVMAERFPFDARPSLHRAALASLRFDRSGFERHADRTLKLAPNDAGVHQRLAIAYSRLGILEKALEHCRRALELKPTSPRVSLEAELKSRYAQQSKPGSSRGTAAAVVVEAESWGRPFHHRNWRRNWRRYGAIMARAGRLDEARRRLTRMTEDWSQEPHAWASRAWVLATAEGVSATDRAEALRCAQRAVELSGRRGPVMLASLAEAQFRSGDRSAAVSTANAVLELLGGENAEWLTVTEMERRLEYYGNR